MALLRPPVRPGEILVRGEAAPERHGPYRLHGRYLVRFEQFAPEDPHADFAAQTAFVARLEHGTRRIALFHRARRTGATVITVDGTWTLVVDFGDFPYAVRITPRPAR